MTAEHLDHGVSDNHVGTRLENIDLVLQETSSQHPWDRSKVVHARTISGSERNDSGLISKHNFGDSDWSTINPLLVHDNVD